MTINETQVSAQMHFSGNIYFFHAFDVGDDIDLEKLEQSQVVPAVKPTVQPKYFKNYHTPLVIDLASNQQCIAAKIHSFGAVSITYKIPFASELEQVRKDLLFLDTEFHNHSLVYMKKLLKQIQHFINKPSLVHTHSSYVVIQVDPQPQKIDTQTLKQEYGGIIASALRFETQTLSEYQKNEILEDAIGYFRGDLIVVDIEAAFVYDMTYEEILDFFEFANIQQLELKYFDRILDQHLNTIYEEKTSKIPVRSYLPLIGSLSKSPIDDLERLKVDISVITERLESSIKLAGEPYFAELYALVVKKVGLDEWRKTVDKKLTIVREVLIIFQNKTDSLREDLLTILIIILIFTELIIGLLGYMKW